MTRKEFATREMATMMTASNSRKSLLFVIAIAIALTSSSAARAQLPNVRTGEVVPRDVREMYDRGLQFLSTTQGDSGDWNGSGGGGEQGAGPTGLALLALLASGEDPNFGLFSNHIRKALRSIINGQDGDTGFLGQSMYHHGFGMLALAEAYGAVDERNLWPSNTKAGNKAPRSIGQALELAVRAAITSQKQNSLNAWRYSPSSTDADTSVSGAVLVGLLAARNAGIEVPDESIDKAISYYKSMTSPTGQVAYAGIGGFERGLRRRPSQGSLRVQGHDRQSCPTSRSNRRGLAGIRDVLSSAGSLSRGCRCLGEMEQNARATLEAVATAQRQLLGTKRPDRLHRHVAFGLGAELSIPTDL